MGITGDGPRFAEHLPSLPPPAGWSMGSWNSTLSSGSKVTHKGACLPEAETRITWVPKLAVTSKPHKTSARVSSRMSSLPALGTECCVICVAVDGSWVLQKHQAVVPQGRKGPLCVIQCPLCHFGYGLALSSCPVLAPPGPYSWSPSRHVACLNCCLLCLS